MFNEQELEFIRPILKGFESKIYSRYIYIKYEGDINEDNVRSYISKSMVKQPKSLIETTHISTKNNKVLAFLTYKKTFRTVNLKFFDHTNIKATFYGVENTDKCLKYMFPNDYQKFSEHYNKMYEENKIKNNTVVEYLPISNKTGNYYYNNMISYAINLAEHYLRLIEFPICGGTKCSHTDNKYTCIHVNILTLFPKMCYNWDFILNGDHKPQHYPKGSNFLANLLCPLNKCDHAHMYSTMVSNAVSDINYCSCPFCREKNKIPCECNNLLKVYPELCKQINNIQFSDIELKNRYINDNYYKNAINNYLKNKYKLKNNEIYSKGEIIDLSKLPYTTSASFTWKCNNCFTGCHLWNSRTDMRVIYGKGCLCCTREPCVHRSIKETQPKLMLQWSDLNQFNNNDPSKISSGSKRKCIWECEKGHLWITAVECRTRGDGCSKCSNHGFSKAQIEWLESIIITDKIFIQHATNGGEYNIPSIGKVDGYCKETNTVYEYHGDYWHGNPRRFKPENMNKSNHILFGVLFQKTYARQKAIKAAGFNLVVKWETNLPSEEIINQVLKIDFHNRNIINMVNVIIVDEFMVENYYNTTEGDTTEGCITEGDITEGCITKGNITEGCITKGNITKCCITKGNITKGCMTKGNMTKGNMTKSNVIKNNAINCINKDKNIDDVVYINNENITKGENNDNECKNVIKGVDTNIYMSRWEYR